MTDNDPNEPKSVDKEVCITIAPDYFPENVRQSPKRRQAGRQRGEMAKLA